MSTIKCTECGHENETQRVYCHNCGARLDRTSLIEEAQKPVKAVRRVKNNAFTQSISGVLGALVKTLLLALIVAGLIQAARPPANAPASTKSIGDELVDAPSVALDLEAVATKPSRIAYTEAQLNAYLKSRVKAPKNPTIPESVLAFDRAYVNLQPGEFHITKEFLLFGQPCFIGGGYVPTANGSALTLKNTGGNIGSLPLPTILFDQIEGFIFADLIKNMKEEAAAAAKLKSIEITPKTAVFSSVAAK